MIKQEIFNDQAIELANFVSKENKEKEHFVEYVKKGGDPFTHIFFSISCVLGLIEEDFWEIVSEYSTEEYKKQLEDFIENEMGE